MVVELTNPAARLHRILAGLREDSGKVSLRRAWGTVLSCQTDQELTVAMATVWSLVDELDSKIRAVRPYMKSARYQATIPAWTRSFVSTESMRAAGKVRPDQIVSKAELVVLEELAADLEYIVPTIALPPGSLDQLLAKSSEVIDLLTSANDLPPLLRMLILERMYDVEKAIRAIRVLGVDAVLESLRMIPSELEAVEKRAKESKSWWDRFSGHPIWAKLADLTRLTKQVTDTANQFDQFLDQAGRFLPPT